ncbi:Dihydroorotase, mitochondrial [Mucuna pruriens]|uniref:Dihydroorotase, mitochondrial n=1 Tax=Mucuna pruriens TaxID=157652 RepID=A0A371ED83_MUCPR|nr:Dihydroorotase, mitochondrial [Mucuna pruriens]
MELTITKPDDWHLHLRDGSLLEAVLPHSAQHFGRAIVMPNLKPLITATTTAVAYRDELVYGVKLYPAGATTNTQDGVTDVFGKCFSVLEEMVEQNIPLLVI